MSGRSRYTVELWLGSFLFVATLLVWYFRAPLVPVLIAGAVTLGVTLLRRWLARNKSSSR